MLIYNSTGFWNRICLPSDININKYSNVTDYIFTDKIDEYFIDLKFSFAMLIISVGIAMLLGFFVMNFLKKFTALLTWAAVFIFFFALILLGIFFIDYSNTLESTENLTFNENA